MSDQGKKASKILVRETHELVQPQNWPEGHVAVTLTPDNIDECIEATIHDVNHYLHSTTARELTKMLEAKLVEWKEVARSAGFPEA
jgi:hypothetical protein